MEEMSKPLVAVIFLVIALSGANCPADPDDEAMGARIRRQLETSGRNQYDGVKDAGRKPVETAFFFGVKAGMTVLDMIAGAGYNAEILSAAVGPNGRVYAQNSHLILRLIDGAHHDAMLGRLAKDRLPNVRYMIVDAKDMPFENSMDMVFWGLNMHDIYNEDGETATLEFLGHVKRALKAGGILAVSDHVGIAGKDNAELHRLEPRIITDMIGKAGFEIEATSDLLGNPTDDHSQSIFADGLRYYTDRILVRARKPK
jgi:predicted methyltransferase